MACSWAHATSCQSLESTVLSPKAPASRGAHEHSQLGVCSQLCVHLLFKAQTDYQRGIGISCPSVAGQSGHHHTLDSILPQE